MANRWEKVEAVRDFIFLGSKITGDCSHEIKTLAPWKQSYDKPRQRVRKQRCHFADKGLCSQSYCFSSSHVRMWELDHKEGWALKNWCFWIVVLEKTLKSLLDCRSNQSVLKEINPEYSLKWLMLKLKLQDLGHLIWRVDSLEKTLIIGKTEGQRRRGWQGMKMLDGITNSVDMNLNKFRKTWRTEEPGGCSPWGPRVGHDLVTAQQQPCIYSRNAVCNLNFATEKVLAHMVSLANATKHLGKAFFYTDCSRR